MPYPNHYRETRSPYVGIIEKPPGQWTPYGPNYNYYPRHMMNHAWSYNMGPMMNPPWIPPGRGLHFQQPPLNSYGARQPAMASPTEPRESASTSSKDTPIQASTPSETKDIAKTDQNTDNNGTSPTQNTDNNGGNRGRTNYRPPFRPPLFNPYPNQNQQAPRFYRQYYLPGPSRYQAQYQGYPNPRYPNPDQGRWNQNPQQRSQNPIAYPVLSITPGKEEASEIGWETSEPPLEHLLPDPSLDFQEWEPMLREMTEW